MSDLKVFSVREALMTHQLRYEIAVTKEQVENTRVN